MEHPARGLEPLRWGDLRSFVQTHSLAFGILVALSLFFPYFEKVHSANELSRIYLVNAILIDKTLSIDGPIRRHGDIPDKSSRLGKTYSDKAPGMAFYAVPAVWLYLKLSPHPTLSGEMRVVRLWGSTIPTFFFLIALYGFLETRLRERALCLTLILAYALGTQVATYSTLFFGHQLSALLIFSCFIAISRSDQSITSTQSALAGFLAAAAVCVEYQNIVFIAPLGLYFLLRTNFHPGRLGVALLAALPFGVALGLYHQHAFGAPWSTGYSFLTSSFKEVHEQGLIGVAQPKWSHFTLSLFSTSRGILFFSPFLAFGFLGLISLSERSRAESRTIVAMVALFVLFVSSMVYPVGGWAVSQRHLTPILPWLLLPLGSLLAQAPWLRPVFIGLAAAGIVINYSSAAIWPHFSEDYANPFYQVAWPLFKEGYVAPSWLNLLNMPSRGLLTGMLLLSGGALAWFMRRWMRSTRSFALALFASAIVASGYLWFGSQWHTTQTVSLDSIKSMYRLKKADDSLFRT